LKKRSPLVRRRERVPARKLVLSSQLSLLPSKPILLETGSMVQVNDEI
jgi:hypothetical protein